MRQYIEQYAEALANAKVVAAERGLDYQEDDSSENFNRRRIANGMVADMREMLRWATYGYDPRVAYENARIDAITMDPYVLDSILTEPTSKYLIDDLMFVEHDERTLEKSRLYSYDCINQALEGLTENERTAFVLHRAEYVTLAKVAEAMSITVSSVRVYIRRAETKIARNRAQQAQERVS